MVILEAGRYSSRQPSNKANWRNLDRKGVTNLSRDEIHAGRKLVMEALYKARELSGDDTLPYIKVRIEDLGNTKTSRGTDSATLGLAYIKNDYIIIDEKVLSFPKNKLFQVVFHELLHAYYNVPHIPTSNLMGPSLKKVLSFKELYSEFVKLVKQYKKR